MKDLHEEGVANHSAPSLARCAGRHAVKRKQRNRWAAYGAPKIRHQGADALNMAEGSRALGDRPPSRTCTPSMVIIFGTTECGKLPGVSQQTASSIATLGRRCPFCTEGLVACLFVDHIPQRLTLHKSLQVFYKEVHVHLVEARSVIGAMWR